MKSEFSLAFNEIMERSGLSRDTVLEALEAMMVSAYRRSVSMSSAQNVEARIDMGSGEPRIFVEKEVVEDVENDITEVSIQQAVTIDPEVELGSVLMVDSTPDDFGRVAAQTAKQVMLQRLREAERDAQYDEYVEREGDMVHGTVHSISPQAITIGLGRAEAVLPRNQQIPGEFFRVRDRVRVYVLEVRKSSRGPVIVVSRSHPHMLRRLLEMEVPEINQGLVEIKAIAREAGKRAKVAVAAMRDGVDPVGACVGLRGVRIQSIVRDLNDEKIDVIEWNPTPATFIAKALSPARVSGVFLDEDPSRGKTAVVVVPEDQLSLAIGRSGVNARLAARLTGWRIDIKSLPESAAESLRRLQEDAILAELAADQADTIARVEGILAKKAENRPVTPEEYQVLTAFVDRVQSTLAMERDVQRAKRREKLSEIRKVIPASAFDVSLDDLELSTRVLNLLKDEGFTNAGQTLEQLHLDADRILSIQGFGPKALSELRELLDAYPYPEPEKPEIVEPEAEVEALAEPSAGPEAEVDADLEAGEAVVVEAEADVAAAIAETEEAPGEGEAEPALEAEAVEEEQPAEGLADEDIPEPEAPEEIDTTEDIEKVFEAFAEKLGVVGYAEKESRYVDDDSLPEVEPKDKDKKRKRKRRQVEFDPDLGETVVRRRRKPGRVEGEWEDLDF